MEPTVDHDCRLRSRIFFASKNVLLPPSFWVPMSFHDTSKYQTDNLRYDCAMPCHLMGIRFESIIILQGTCSNFLRKYIKLFSTWLVFNSRKKRLKFGDGLLAEVGLAYYLTHHGWVRLKWGVIGQHEGSVAIETGKLNFAEM